MFLFCRTSLNVLSPSHCRKDISNPHQLKKHLLLCVMLLWWTLVSVQICLGSHELHLFIFIYCNSQREMPLSTKPVEPLVISLIYLPAMAVSFAFNCCRNLLVFVFISIKYQFDCGEICTSHTKHRNPLSYSFQHTFRVYHDALI